MTIQKNGKKTHKAWTGQGGGPARGGTVARAVAIAVKRIGILGFASLCKVWHCITLLIVLGFPGSGIPGGSSIPVKRNWHSRVCFAL